jgi:hypothetical protein
MNRIEEFACGDDNLERSEVPARLPGATAAP